MSAIERAIATALDAHEGQVDKGGAPYILHPLRVMATVEQMCPDCPEEVLVAAVLHDVIEDSHFSHLDIQQMFGDKVKRYVTLLTKEIPDDLYYQLIKRDLYACYIKLADLRDNMDASRLSEITEKDVIRINNYKRREQEIIAAIASFH